MKETDIFRAELTCRDAAVEKMNLHLSVATFDAEGRQTAMAHSDDGPAFLSLLVITGGACPGAAHPWGQADTVNFDLSTGRQTDLMPFLPTARLRTSYRSGRPSSSSFRSGKTTR